MPRGEQEPVRIIGASDGTISDPIGTSGGVADAGNHSSSNDTPVSERPGVIVVDPSELGGSGDAGSAGAGPEQSGRRRRGRPPGSAAGTRKAQTGNLNPKGIESLLFNMHTMLAGMTGAVELKLEKEEAESLASAIVDVGRFYNMEVPAKAAAWTNLIMVAGALYGPRVMVLNMKRKANKSAIPMPPRGSVAPKAEPAPKGDNGNVIEIPGVGKVVR